MREYKKQQDAKYPPVDLSKQSNSRRTNKRKATTKLDGERQVKMAKYCDLYGMKEKYALNKSLTATPKSTMADDSKSSSINDDASSTTSHQSNSHDFNYDLNTDCSSIELNLRRLCALCKLTHPEFKPKIVPKVGKAKVNDPECHDEEYKISKIIKLEYDWRQPMFEVKWEGYEEKTWEPIKNIWDCSAFQIFTENFIRSRKDDMQQLWNELLENIERESLEPVITDFDAVQQTIRFNYNDFIAHFFMLVRLHRANESKTSKNYKNISGFLLNDLKYLRYYNKRLDQLQTMNEFQLRINVADKSKNLHVENIVDLEMPPIHEFIYTNDVIPRDGIEIPNDPPVGCNCTEENGQCSLKSECCPEQFDAQFAYNARGLVRVKQGTPIFECNKACKCSENCQNRVVQKGRKQTLCIFKTAGRGWGVRTERPIAKGQYICEYVGEIISYEETERRGREYDAVGRTYLFDLDFNEKDNPYTVDAAKFGNVSRFINHSCDPNLGVWAVWTDCLDLNLPKLCLFTLRSIKENEELTFDYVNCTNNNKNERNSDSEESLIEYVISSSKKDVNIEQQPLADASIDEKNDEFLIKTDITDEIVINQEDIRNEEKQIENNAVDDNIKYTKKEGFTCRCGAANCRKIIFC